MVALVVAGYGAISYFATAEQLEKTEVELKRIQTEQHGEALGELSKLECINRLNRKLLRAELEEFRLTTLLQKNILDVEKLSGSESEMSRLTRASLAANRDTLVRKLDAAGNKKGQILTELRDGACAEPALQ